MMGFTYSTKRKSYMVDGNKHPAQRKHRNELTDEYLTILETRSHLWIQTTKAEFDELSERSEILNTGFTYTRVDGNDMIELHVGITFIHWVGWAMTKNHTPAS